MTCERAVRARSCVYSRAPRCAHPVDEPRPPFVVPDERAERWDAFFTTKSGTRSFWTKIGVAFTNNDGSLNVRLNALPINGEMQLREPKEREPGSDDQE